jgi:hypothetical protein
MIAGVGMLLVGAFLQWGPIGLGNGPVTAAPFETGGGTDPTSVPVGFIISVRNSGQAPAMIEGIEIIGGTAYPAPRLLSLAVVTSGQCGGIWPTRQTARGFVLAGCGGKYSGPLIGRPIGPTRPHSYYGLPVAAEVAAPHPGTCWVVTKVVVHYHVGIRQYSATSPYELAVCTHEAAVGAAMTAAETSG